MAITRRRLRSGVIVAEVLTTDLEGDAATVAAEIDAVDPGAEVILRGYIDAADRVLTEVQQGTPRWKVARASKRHAKASIEYLKKGDAESATWNALQASRNAWIADVKLVEPKIVTGHKIRGGGDKGRRNRQAAANPVHAAWRKRADEIRRNNRRLSDAEIARRIDVTRWQTIRKIIAKEK